MEKTKMLLIELKKIWRKNEISVYASSMAYFLFLSLIPLLLFISTLLPLLPIDERSLAGYLEEMIPSASGGWVTNLTKQLYRKRPGLLSLSFFTTMWSSGKGMMAFMKALNSIHNLEEKRGYFRLRITAAGYTAVATVGFLFSLSIKVFSRNTLQLLWLPILLFLFFLSLYTFIPGKKISPFDQLPGAVFATFSWTMFSYGFSFYVENFRPFSGYGIFGTVLLVLLWLYFGSYILLLGGIINTLKKK